MEPYTKSYNETYLDYIKGKPVPKPVTPPEVLDDDDDSIACEHHDHDHGSRHSHFPQNEELDQNMYLSKGQPKIENVKTALEVPPLSGVDYTNPSYTKRLEEQSQTDGFLTPNKPLNTTRTYNTGLPETAPGHDSVLLSKSYTEEKGQRDVKEINTGSQYKLGKSQSQYMTSTRNSLPDAYSFRADMYNQPTFNSTFM